MQADRQKAANGTHLHRSYTGLRVKLIVALLLATVPTVLLVGYLGLETTTHLLRAQVEQSLRDTVISRSRRIQDYLSRAAADARYLAQSEEATRYAGALAAGREPPAEARKRLLAQFQALGQATGLYRRVRFLDASGRERVRLGPPVRDAGDEATAARRLERSRTAWKPGQVAVSPLLLDLGVAEGPRSRRAIVRYAAPVFVKRQFAGTITLDAVPRTLLGGPVLPGAISFVADPQGWYYAHSEPDRAWSGPWGRGTGHSVHRDYGSAAALMLRPLTAAQNIGSRIVVSTPVLLGNPAAGDYVLVVLDVPSEIALAGVAGFRRFFWYVLAISFVVPVAAGLTLGAFFLRPMRRLEQGMHAVATGNLDTRVDIRSGDEFEHLAQDFHAMLSRLRELRQQERVAVVGHLAGNISHDIKNMLTPLHGTAETLSVIFVDMFSRLDAIVADPNVPEQVKNHLVAATAELRAFYPDAVEMILQGSLGIQDRVREIADYVKGVTAEPMIEPTDACEVAERAIKPLVFVGSRRGVEVALHCADGLPPVPADQRLLFSAIYNLVNNAIAATPEGGRVDVRLDAHPNGSFPDGDYLSIEVADTGRGMPEEIRATLFTANARSTKADGTGLGTRIVKNAIDAHGGIITVESTLGKGSTFRIRLPLQRRKPTPTEAPAFVPADRVPV